MTRFISKLLLLRKAPTMSLFSKPSPALASRALPCNMQTRYYAEPNRRLPSRLSVSSAPAPKPVSVPTSTAPRSHDRGPTSTEDTQTDFDSMDVLGATPVPSSSIDACLWDGFHLNNGVKVNGSGVLLVGGEAFAWRPWRTGEGKRLVNAKGQFEVGEGSWGVLELVWPKPDLLIIGLGPTMAPLSPKTRTYINGLGIRIDIQDTRNACAQFNLLATERGVGSVAAALIPIGWREGKGVE